MPTSSHQGRSGDTGIPPSRQRKNAAWLPLSAAPACAGPSAQASRPSALSLAVMRDTRRVTYNQRTPIRPTPMPRRIAYLTCALLASLLEGVGEIDTTRQDREQDPGLISVGHG